MNEMPTKLEARAARKNAKRDEKKRQIADSAIEALWHCKGTLFTPENSSNYLNAVAPVSAGTS